MLEKLKLELSIQRNEPLENIIVNYADIIKTNIKIDWQSINESIIAKYGQDVLDYVKQQAWIIVNKKIIADFS